MVRSVHVCLSLGAVALVACEAPPAEEMIDFEVQTVALIDIACDESGVCQGDEVVDAELNFRAGVSVLETNVELLQYEVTFDFGEDAPAPPPFSSPMQLIVTSGTQRLFAIRTAGIDQRQWAATYFPQTRVEAKGRITMYGYDQKNRIVTVKGPFDAVFDDFLGGGDTVTTTP